MKFQLDSVASAKGDTERLAREVGKLRGQLAYYQQNGRASNDQSIVGQARRSSSAAPSPLMAQHSSSESAPRQLPKSNAKQATSRSASEKARHKRQIAPREDDGSESSDSLSFLLS
eukprot:GILI01033763.1.p1 GENE.GILI01033763.1~~GILI01033763.1.p1  ORF type:complete len:116 (+),score=9.09 GILI01033763.1:260-607(+)